MDFRRYCIALGALSSIVVCLGAIGIGNAQQQPSAADFAKSLPPTNLSNETQAKRVRHRAGQALRNGNFFQGAYGPCQLFPGNAVNANGWCTGYAKKA